MTHELSGVRIYPNFNHELDLQEYWWNKLRTKGGIFIEVGANVGVYTIALASLFDVVYAIEPYYAEQLRTNIKDYGVDNVVVIEAAAWDFNGSVVIGIARYDDGTAVPRVGIPETVVKSIKIDDVVNKPFRLLKIDVEGEAIHVLRGMTRLLSTSSGFAQIEVHNHAESHGTYLFMQKYGWKLHETLHERASGDKYHAYKVFVK